MILELKIRMLKTESNYIKNKVREIFLFFSSEN
jgi:hypothetical protein